MQLSAQAVSAGFKLTQFADGFQTSGIPLGIVFPSGGGVLVSDFGGNVRLFPSDADVQHATNVTPAQNYGYQCSIGLALSVGHVYMADRCGARLVELNDNGTLNQVIVTSLSGITGLATRPGNGHIFASRIAGGGISDIDPNTKTVTPFQSSGTYDGVIFSPDGGTLYAEINQHIIGYRVSDGAQVFDSGFIAGADGAAVGTGSLAGQLFVNTNDGRLVEVNIASGVQTVLASGGSRGDFVSLDPNGSLLITQTSTILRLQSPTGGGFGGGSGSALQFYVLPPCRVLDTRSAAGPFGGPPITGGNSRSFTIPSSACGIPATAAAYSLNVTVVPQGPLGFLTVWPTGQAQPNVSTLNSPDGAVIANAAIVPAGSAGAVSFFASNTTNLVVDINGYFAPPGTGGLNFFASAPCRLVDTRNPAGPLSGPIMNGDSTRTFPLPASTCGLPATAAAYSLNATVQPSGPLGYLTIWPTGQTRPLVSTLNAPKGLVLANAALVPSGPNGPVDVYVLNNTHVIIDANGYFQ